MQKIERHRSTAKDAATLKRPIIPPEHIEALTKASIEDEGKRIRSFGIGVPSVQPNTMKLVLKSMYYILDRVGHKAPSFPGVLLIGPPGVGKSTVVKEVAKEIAKEQGKDIVDITDDSNQMWLYEQIEACKDSAVCLKDLANRYFVLLDLRLTEVEPQDLLGLPRAERGIMRYAPPLWAVILSHIPGILFLDEITNVDRPDVLAASYKLMLDRCAGFVKFNPKVMVVAAGNLSSHAPGLARPLPLPLINRSAVYMVDAPTVDEWYEWTKGEITNILSEESDEVLKDYMGTLELVRAFLSTTKEFGLLAIGAGVRNPDINENSPTPRSWSHLVFSTPLSLLRALENKPELMHSYIASFVGIQAAAKFIVAVKTGLRIDYDKVLRDPMEIEQIIMSLDEKDRIEAIPIVAHMLGVELVNRTMPVSEKAETAKNIGKALISVSGKIADVSLGKSVLEVFMRVIMYEYHSRYKAAQTLRLPIDKIMSERDAVMSKLNELKREFEAGQLGRV